MFHNRIYQSPADPPTPAPDPDAASLANAFVLWTPGCFFPIAPEFSQWQQALYELAYNQARELLRPSLIERDWLGVWN